MSAESLPGWDLRHGEAGGYQLSRCNLTVDTSDWDWADVDGDRLVWTAKGCLWAGVMREDGLQQIELLQDFTGMKFEMIDAPYGTGDPARPEQTEAGA